MWVVSFCVQQRLPLHVYMSESVCVCCRADRGSLICVVAQDATLAEIEAAALKAYGPRLHRALRGGPYAERQYNCQLADLMLPHILPPDAKNSK